MVPSPVSASGVSQRLSKVPPFPPVASRLLRLLSDNSVQLKEVAQTIACDATFSARVLQYANSAEFALEQPVSNLRHALTIIGLERTRRIVTTVATAVYSGSALRATELRRCWQHTVATGVIAGFIARACGQFVDLAYTAGIMHDIGRLGLLVAYPEEYENTIRDAAERCLDLLDFERDVFGVDHSEAGRWLAERWRLPEEFLVITGRHHDPCEGAEVTLLKIVHLACRLADAFGCDVTRPLKPTTIEAIVEPLPASARRRLLDEVDEIRAQLDDSVHRFDRADVAEDFFKEAEPCREAEAEAAVPFVVDLPHFAAVEEPHARRPSLSCVLTWLARVLLRRKQLQ